MARAMTLGEYHKILGNLDFLERYKYYINPADQHKYRILETTFEVRFFNGRFYFADRAAASEFYWTFEQVLSKLPEEVAAKFLFHLDIFR